MENPDCLTDGCFKYSSFCAESGSLALSNGGKLFYRTSNIHEVVATCLESSFFRARHFLSSQRKWPFFLIYEPVPPLPPGIVGDAESHSAYVSFALPEHWRHSLYQRTIQNQWTRVYSSIMVLHSPLVPLWHVHQLVIGGVARQGRSSDSQRIRMLAQKSNHRKLSNPTPVVLRCFYGYGLSILYIIYVSFLNNLLDDPKSASLTTNCHASIRKLEEPASPIQPSLSRLAPRRMRSMAWLSQAEALHPSWLC